MHDDLSGCYFIAYCLPWEICPILPGALSQTYHDDVKGSFGR
jgi:hypothetical protein